jgi:hypothetical protein
MERQSFSARKLKEKGRKTGRDSLHGIAQLLAVKNLFNEATLVEERDDKISIETRVERAAEDLLEDVVDNVVEEVVEWEGEEEVEEGGEEVVVDELLLEKISWCEGGK